jgi:hypothetical protein
MSTGTMARQLRGTVTGLSGRLAVLGALVAATILGGTMVAGCSAKDQPIESGRRFLTTVYVDSQNETFARSSRYLRGTIADKGDTIAYVALLSDSGLVTSVDVTERNPRRGVVGRSRLFTLPKSTLPLMHGSGALFEQLLRRVRAIGGDSVSVPVMRLGREEVLDVITVTSNGPDSLILSYQSSQSSKNTLHVAIDTAWRITGAVLPLSGMRIQAQD